MLPLEIKSFLQQFAAGQHTDADHQRFAEWLSTAPIADVETALDEYYSIIHQQQQPLATPDTDLIEKIEAGISQYALGKPMVQPMATGRGWGRMLQLAAALLLFFVGAGSVWLFIHKTTTVKEKQLAHAEPKKRSNELLPGSNKATLTLANGDVISLDDAKNGQLAVQGNTVVQKAAGGALLYRPENTDALAIVYNTLSTPRGGQYRLQLPDGTEVWLNAAASITYPTAFSGNERRVEITGEAYFEVAHDAAKPFIVNVRGMEIKVLGTHFNVNAYTDEAAITTSLLQGSISISRGSAAVLLQPGEQARLAGNGDVKLLKDADMEEAIAWKSGYFSFNRADLKTVMRQIARWYDVTISYEGKIPERFFGGKIDRNSNASEVLKILEESKVRFTIEGKKIIVHP
ncbi:MAG TPA: FecR domain-containing protein [Chitinophagaceae bacterium]|nr:FecR domain-containing protein [Chitinophagaceae bacterium]